MKKDANTRLREVVRNIVTEAMGKKYTGGQSTNEALAAAITKVLREADIEKIGVFPFDVDSISPGNSPTEFNILASWPGESPIDFTVSVRISSSKGIHEHDDNLAELDVDRVNTSIMSDQIKARLSDEFFEMAREMVHQTEEKVIIEASQIIDQNNLTDTQFGRMTPRLLRQTVENFDENVDDKMTLMQECASDLEETLTKFATQLGDYIVSIISSSTR
jgi:hypothetical protein